MWFSLFFFFPLLSPLSLFFLLSSLPLSPFSPSFPPSLLLFLLKPRAASTLSLCPQVKVHDLLSAYQAEGCSPVYILEMMSKLQDYFPVGSLTSLWPFLGNFHHHSYYYYTKKQVCQRGKRYPHCHPTPWKIYRHFASGQTQVMVPGTFQVICRSPIQEVSL